MQPVTLTALSDLAGLSADTVIDVRSPSEYAEDHLPGAINLPVLSDAERAEVGTIYKQVSPFDARKLGGALVARNTAGHLDGPLADRQGAWQPLVYCWRGGQRSGAFATILDQVGWRVQLLRGGYKSYRRLVVARLYDDPLSHRLRILDGGTGTAKTRLLHHLAESGAQVLDLEGLARHRGSVLGGMPGGQPEQKMFESQLAMALVRLDPERVTWVEAESSKIGARLVPPTLWAAMVAASRLRVEAPLEERAAYLARAYSDLIEDPETLRRQIDLLRPFHSTETIEGWHTFADAGEWQALARGLMADHYDARYAKSAARGETPEREITLSRLDDDTLAETARKLAAEFT
jgi:tRNA 2-selenouridine synthase